MGRSPRSIADLTFRVIRRGDLWFHARAMAGAHIILQIDSQRAPRDEELRRAAELAAHHNKARGSAKVAVDYTDHKCVRRRQRAPPGLVWDTDAQTLLAAPHA